MNKITLTSLVAFFASILLMSTSHAAQVNFGPFAGTLTTTVSQGFQVRASDTACELNSGAATTFSTAQLALIGAEDNTGNGGCDKNMTSSLGTSSKVVGIGSPFGTIIVYYLVVTFLDATSTCIISIGKVGGKVTRYPTCWD